MVSLSAYKSRMLPFISVFFISLVILAIINFFYYFSTFFKHSQYEHVHYSYLRVPEHNRSINEVIQDKNFKPLTINEHFLIHEPTWLKIELTNPENKIQNLSFYFDNILMNHISIFKSNMIQEIQTTTHFISREVSTFDKFKTLPKTPPGVININLEPLSNTTYYIQFVSNRTQPIPLWLIERDEYKKISSLIHSFWGGFNAIIFLVTLGLLFNYFVNKESIFLIYSGFVIVSWIQQSSLHGFGIYYLPTEIFLFFSKNIISFTFLLQATFLIFVKINLEKTNESKKLHSLILFNIMLFVILCGLGFISPHFSSMKILFICQPIFYITILWMSYSHWIQSKVWEKLFILSWMILLISGIFPSLLYLGIIEYSFSHRYAFMLGTIISIFLISIALTTKHREIQKQSMIQFSHDPISEKPNRTSLQFALKQLMDQKTPFTLCCFKMSRYTSFEPYISDKEKIYLIRYIAQKLEQILISPDILMISTQVNTFSRIASIKDGIFYFAILSHNKDYIDTILSNVIHQIDSVIELDHFNLRIQGKIGISVYPRDSHHPDSLINKSLQALTSAKPSSRRIQEYDYVSALNHQTNINLIHDLKRAIENDELQLYHQPQILLTSGNIHGSEMLLRWNHPKLGFISPECFVKIAEKVGLINQLTLWVLNQSFIQQSQLIKQGFQHRFSINVSASDLAITNFIDHIMTASEKYQVPTHLLSIELTESALVKDFDQLNQTLDAFLSHQIELSIDDYGTGYSSLNYLSQLPFSELKIDREFIQDLVHNSRMQKIVKATSKMAKSLNLTLVAEGVEDKETIDVLKEFGVHIGQGYYYSKPLPLDEYINYLKTYHSNTHKPVHHIEFQATTSTDEPLLDSHERYS